MEKTKNRNERSECSNFEVEKCGDDDWKSSFTFFCFRLFSLLGFPETQRRHPIIFDLDATKSGKLP